VKQETGREGENCWWCMQRYESRKGGGNMNAMQRVLTPPLLNDTRLDDVKGEGRNEIETMA